jgi:hypothetical protein
MKPTAPTKKAHRDRCPACLSSGMYEFLTVEMVPIYANFLWDSKVEAISCPRADIRLGFCHACGMIFNLAFDPAALAYTGAYENSLHFSPTFQDYAEQLADRLIRRYGIRGKDVVAIGEGDGWFLELLCRMGANHGVAFDPNRQPKVEPAWANVEFVRDYYGERYSSKKVDLMLCRHVLEHLANPYDFLKMLRRTLDARTVLYVEVPNSLLIFREQRVWDLIYEHCSYFTPASLIGLFQATGFRVLDMSIAYENQFLGVEAMPGTSEHRLENVGPAEVRELETLVHGFAEGLRGLVQRWNERLADWTGQGRKIVVWGAGTKGITFLNLVPGAQHIDHVVDINPRKQGHYIAGTGQQIIDPAELAQIQPDVILEMNPAYEDEIRGMLEEHGVGADVVAV